MSIERYLRSTPRCPACPHGILSEHDRDGQHGECPGCRRRFTASEVFDA